MSVDATYYFEVKCPKDNIDKAVKKLKSFWWDWDDVEWEKWEEIKDSKEQKKGMEKLVLEKSSKTNSIPTYKWWSKLKYWSKYLKKKIKEKINKLKKLGVSAKLEVEEKIGSKPYERKTVYKFSPNSEREKKQ